MGLSKVTLLGLVLLSVTSAQLSVNRSDDAEYYTAAVFEHSRRGNSTTQSPAEIINENLGYYARATEVAKSQGADIIVFPEYGVYPFLSRTEMKQYLETVSDPVGNWNPCLQKEFSDRIMLHTLSCMARENAIYVVANIGDIQPCNGKFNCSDDGTLHYNANVVFDREGRLISRYRKEHLFFEIGMDLPQETQEPIFVTEFGIFAHFVCFDVIFKHIVEAAENPTVDAIILSTMWFNSMPNYNALQFWQSWSIGNQVPLIVANIQKPGLSAVGSGVFTGKLGAIKYTHNPDGKSKVLISRVPKNKNQDKPFENPAATITVITSNGTEAYNEESVDFDNYIPEVCSSKIIGESPNVNKDYRCYYEDMSNHTLVKLDKLEDHVEVCNNGLCCTLDYSVDEMNDTFYLGVTNKTHISVDRYYWCIENCFVARCDSGNGTSCEVFPTKSSTVFNQLKLSGKFSTPYVYPSVVRSGMRLASMDEWTFNKTLVEAQAHKATINYQKTPESKSMLTTSLFARCYDRDPPYKR